MDAVSATIVVGRRPIILKQEASIEKYKYLSTIIYDIYYRITSSATSPSTMDGSPARSIVPNHQLHVAGEEGGSATKVAVFLPVLPVGVVLWLSSHDVTRSSYVAVATKKTKGGADAGVRYVI